MYALVPAAINVIRDDQYDRRRFVAEVPQRDDASQGSRPRVESPAAARASN